MVVLVGADHGSLEAMSLGRAQHGLESNVSYKLLTQVGIGKYSTGTKARRADGAWPLVRPLTPNLKPQTSNLQG